MLFLQVYFTRQKDFPQRTSTPNITLIETSKQYGNAAVSISDKQFMEFLFQCSITISLVKDVCNPILNVY